MRDPERIPELLGLLQQVWERYPDQRLTQLVLNACREVAGAAWPDVWSVEDRDLRRALERMLRRAQHGGRTWLLKRQDDNGNVFVVTDYPAPEEAEEARRDYESRGHKQRYWVEESPSAEGLGDGGA